MIIKRIISMILVITFIGCSNSKEETKKIDIEDTKSPEEMYVIATNYFEIKNFELAETKFRELIKLYPLSNEAVQSEISIGFIKYLNMDYDAAQVHFKKITRKYPSLKDLDYVYYMIAMCNYEQITNYSLDGMYNDLALSSFQQVINRFPMSKYAKDSRQKIILVKSNKAGKHMDIGRFYLKDRKYTAALNRFKIVVEEYSMTKFSPEALHRMVEIYFHLGMKTEAVNSASVLGYNYPKSKWYRYSYELIKEKDKDDSFLNKLIKPFS